MKASHTLTPVFDDPNLIGAAGLLPVLRLAETAGLDEHLDRLSVPCPNAVTKTIAVVAGMLAGADSIDDLDVLRHGGMTRVCTGIRAPSTLGTFLRSFTHGHVQQVDAAAARTLAGLTATVPALLAGAGRGGMALIDVDDTIRQVHGYAKQGAAFGYTKVRGLNIALATVSTPIAGPVIAAARLRSGNTASAQGAGRLLAHAIGVARAAGARGQVLARADSAYYGWAFVGTAIRHQAWFSVTARMTAAVLAAISQIDENAWQAIQYPNAIREVDEATGTEYWVSDAQVAQVPFTAFTGRRKTQHVSCRLVVRRVKRLQPRASDGSQQGELFTAWRHHAFITNSTLTVIDADAYHRGHAVIEQTIAELKDGPLAHLPSGSYAANAAWVACAVIAFNLARAAAVAAGIATARWASLRTQLIHTPARIAASGRRQVLHLPTGWRWQPAWQTLWATATGPPRPVSP